MLDGSSSTRESLVVTTIFSRTTLLECGWCGSSFMSAITSKQGGGGGSGEESTEAVYSSTGRGFLVEVEGTFPSNTNFLTPK